MKGVTPPVAESQKRARRINGVLLSIIGVFVFLWALVVIWELGAVRDFDSWLTTWLNSLLHRSETLDLTVVFLSRTPGDYLAAVIGALLVFRLMVRRGKASPVNIATMAAYVAIVLLVTYELVDMLDHYVRRPPPGEELAEVLRNPGAMIEAEYRFPARTRFPSERVALLTSLSFLCFFRFGTRALVLFILPLIAGIVRIMAGVSWPTDILGGFFFGWLVAVVIYMVRANEMYNYVDDKAEDLYRRGLRGRAFRWFSGIGGKAEPEKLFTVSLPEEGMEESRASSPEFEDFLLPLAKAEWGFEKCFLMAPPHKKKLFPVSDGDKLYALKISRLGEQRVANLEAALVLSQELRAKKLINVPRVIPTREGKLLLSFEDKSVYLMEWIQGRPLDVGDLDQFRGVMRILAQLHKETEVPPDGHTPGAHEVINREVALLSERIRDSRRHFQGFFRSLLPTNAETQELSQTLAGAIKCEMIARFAYVYVAEDNAVHRPCVVHGDSHPMNYHVGPDGRMFLLDFDYMKRDVGFRDLISPLSKFLRRFNWNPDVFHEVLNEYTSIRPLDRWELALLLAHLTFPTPIQKLAKERKRLLFMMTRKQRFRMARYNVQYSIEAQARADFIAAAADRYGLPLIKTAAAATHSGEAIAAGETDDAGSEKLPAPEEETKV